jgi:hypothetical protein
MQLQMENIHLEKGISKKHMKESCCRFDRDQNIIKGKYDCEELKYFKEAQDLVEKMISFNASKRPTANQVLNHVLFWDDEKRLNFICEVSDRIEFEQTGNNFGFAKYCRELD